MKLDGLSQDQGSNQDILSGILYLVLGLYVLIPSYSISITLLLVLDGCTLITSSTLWWLYFYCMEWMHYLITNRKGLKISSLVLHYCERV